MPNIKIPKPIKEFLGLLNDEVNCDHFSFSHFPPQTLKTYPPCFASNQAFRFFSSKKTPINKWVTFVLIQTINQP